MWVEVSQCIDVEETDDAKELQFAELPIVDRLKVSEELVDGEPGRLQESLQLAQKELG